MWASRKQNSHDGNKTADLIKAFVCTVFAGFSGVITTCRQRLLFLFSYLCVCVFVFVGGIFRVSSQQTGLLAKYIISPASCMHIESHDHHVSFTFDCLYSPTAAFFQACGKTAVVSALISFTLLR